MLSRKNEGRKWGLSSLGKEAKETKRGSVTLMWRLNLVWLTQNSTIKLNQIHF